MPTIKRHFPGWDKPLVEKTVEILSADWEQGVLDLEDTYIMVPTRNAARRLREALAEASAARNSAVTPGPIVPPDQLIAPKPPLQHSIASVAESLAAWTRLLLQIDLANYPALFPYAPASFNQDSTWAVSTARRLNRLRADLAENGLIIATAAERLAASELQPEPERWEDMMRLEGEYLKQLKNLDLQDPENVKIEAARAPRLPEGVKSIKIFGVADPMPLAITALKKLANDLPIAIYVHAPPSVAERFDEWGRPVVEAWENARIDIPNPDRTLLLSQKPEHQAEMTTHMISNKTVAANNLAIGAPDNEVVPYLEHELKEAGWITFNPAGVPLEEHSLVRLSNSLIRFLQNPQYAQFAELLRHPYFLEHFNQSIDGFKPARCLAQLDTIQNKHLPVSFADTARFTAEDYPNAELHTICNAADKFLGKKHEANPISETVLDILRELFENSTLSVNSSEDRIFQQAAEHVRQAVLDIDTDTVRKLQLPDDAVMDIMTTRLRNLRYYEDRADAAIDLQGWLELAWEDAPNLILTGMNEGRVPATVTADPFLPDSARAILGLSDNRRRFARDAFLLQTMINTRREDGNLYFVIGKQSPQGDPLKPSRLLFRCPDTELPTRAARLFTEAPAHTSPTVNRDHSWKLSIPEAALPERLRVTQFKDYLTCPFRFYLTHILEMEEVDDSKVELDALDFGNLCHKALEVLGDEQLRGVTDSAVLENSLLNKLDELTRQRFGETWPAPVYFQIEALRQRLRAAAGVQARLHREGWTVMKTEINMGEDSSQFEIDGMRISGRIDRIDRHDNGMIRILDYKTSESTTTPAKMLWGTSREHTPDYARINDNGKERAWTDLQLPLYTLYWLENHPGNEIEAGYFYLPKAVSDTTVETWAPETDILDSARRCAAGVVQDIQNGKFWPPAANLKYDDYERLFFGTPTNAATPASFISGSMAKSAGK
ncbi:MAG: PD-(D/E)XK nuclease family protein [Lentisphaeria bacterium]